MLSVGKSFVPNHKTFRKNDGVSMSKRKIKWMAVLVVLLVTVYGLAACGEKPEEIKATGPHEPTEPAPPLPYSEVTKIHFRETFGGYFEVDVTATRDKIQYRCFKQDVLRESEPEVMNGTFECGQSVWDGLLSVLNDNHVDVWTEQEFYLNRYYNQQANLFGECSEVEFVREGDFFNITDNTSMYSLLLYLPRYYGIDQNEKKFRSDYDSFFEVYTDYGEMPYLWRSYESYGVPKEYNRFRKEFWDLIVGHTGIPDWRLEVGDWGRENLYKKYPYMLQDDQERQIRYFSLLENYGCDENHSSLAVSLVYDGGEQCILHECNFQGNIYSVGKSGQPVLYSERKPAFTGGVSKRNEVPMIPEGLSEIIERYEVENWKTESHGTGYVRQGEFYNIENARQVKDKNEQIVRSGYGALIHVVYTNGDHVEIQLENGQLPEAYNDFRDELWDYMIPYMNEGRAEEERIVDWRDLIDQWGEENLRLKYPYIR